MEYASNAKGNLGVTLGAVGSALGALNSGLGLVGGMNPHGSISNYVTKDELKYVQELAAKDCEIALLKSEQNTEIKIADVKCYCCECKFNSCITGCVRKVN